MAPLSPFAFMAGLPSYLFIGVRRCSPEARFNSSRAPGIIPLGMTVRGGRFRVFFDNRLLVLMGIIVSFALPSTSSTMLEKPLTSPSSADTKGSTSSCRFLALSPFFYPLLPCLFLTNMTWVLQVLYVNIEDFSPLL